MRIGFIHSIDNRYVGRLHHCAAIIVATGPAGKYGRAQVKSIEHPGCCQVAPGVAAVYGPAKASTVELLERPAHRVIILALPEQPKPSSRLARAIAAMRAGGRTIYIAIIDEKRPCGIDIHPATTGPALVTVPFRGLREPFIPRPTVRRRRSTGSVMAIQEPAQAPVVATPVPVPPPEPKAEEPKPKRRKVTPKPKIAPTPKPKPEAATD
jgi:hypothetical protein